MISCERCNHEKDDSTLSEWMDYLKNEFCMGKKKRNRYARVKVVAELPTLVLATVSYSQAILYPQIFRRSRGYSEWVASHIANLSGVSADILLKCVVAGCRLVANLRELLAGFHTGPIGSASQLQLLRDEIIQGLILFQVDILEWQSLDLDGLLSTAILSGINHILDDFMTYHTEQINCHCDIYQEITWQEEMQQFYVY